MNKVVRGSKGDAERTLTQLLGSRDDGLRQRPTRVTLGAWVEEWVDKWSVGGSDRTRNDYRAIFERYLWPDELHRLHPDKAAKAAGRAAEKGEDWKASPPRQTRADERLIQAAKRLRVRKLADLSSGDIQEFVNTLKACSLSPRTIRMAHGAIRVCLNTAVEQKKLPLNPATGAKLPRQTRREMLYLRPEEAQGFLNAAEAEQRSLDAAESLYEGVYALFVTMILSGLRVGETLALRWTDLDGSTLRVQRAVTQGPDRRKVVGPTKTGRSRTVPLGERAMRALTRHRTAQKRWKLRLAEAYKDQDLIFTSEFGGLLDAQNVVNRYFKPLLVKAELPAIRLYDLRHTHATLLMAADQHPKVVQERLGHASIQLTLDTYSHVVPGMQERASERLDALLATPPRAAAQA
ncbi:MAG: tyrosine-type recombinase/integrase [Acidimicrobiia bacterium]